MRAKLWAVTLMILMAAVFGSSSGYAADLSKPHRVVIQVDQNDADMMNLALNNADNIAEYYKHIGQEVELEIVAYGPGLHMLRDDTSPVKERIKRMSASLPSAVKFSACGVTKAGMEKREGKSVPIVPQATVVPSGAVRLMERQEQGWSYLRP